MFFRKKKYNPRENCDWDVYWEDFDNGVPWAIQRDKLANGLYEKGIAKPEPNYGKIDNTELYDFMVKKHGKEYAEMLRRCGVFMND